MREEKILRITGIIAIILVTYFLILTVTYDFPTFGLPVQRVGQYYIENTLKDIGAWNAVCAIVWDYRGYDTLGETLVLFTAVIVVVVVFKVGLRERNEYNR